MFQQYVHGGKPEKRGIVDENNDSCDRPAGDANLSMICVNKASDLYWITAWHRARGRENFDCIWKMFRPVTFVVKESLFSDSRDQFVDNDHAVGVFLEVTKNTLGSSKVPFSWCNRMLGKCIKCIIYVKKKKTNITHQLILPIFKRKK